MALRANDLSGTKFLLVVSDVGFPRGEARNVNRGGSAALLFVWGVVCGHFLGWRGCLVWLLDLRRLLIGLFFDRGV